jgi:hypothetical protein
MEDSTVMASAKRTMRNGKGITKSSFGASGGILTLWDLLQWELEVSFCANHWILTVLRNTKSNIKLYFHQYLYAK